MKKQIRNNIFETNSSSTHSISIASDAPTGNLLDTLIPDEHGNVVLKGNEFGWYVDDFYNAEDKASYLAIYAVDWSGENKEKHIQVLKDVIIQQTGCNDVIFLFNTDEYNVVPELYKDDVTGWAYIDHQSVEDRDYDYIFKDPELVRKFIFNKNSYLHTDNDNH